NGPKIPNPTAAQLASDFWYSTTKDFGNTKHFECTNTPTCSTEIIAYLTKIQNMGFNTVRIAGAPQWNPDKTPKANKFYLRSFQYCPNIDLCWDDTDYLEIDKPFNTSPVLDFYLDNMEQFYAIATQPPFNFKIIVELALGGSYISGIPGHQNDYLELMDEYVARFKNNPNLIYYIIASETQYTENFFIKKEDVCNYTTPWYDHLKTQDDYHHLVNTTGIITDVIYWDPSVIKSDIFSLHPYTFIRDFEKTAGYPTYTVARDRVLSQFYWLKNHCPKPWLIGETGFKATNSPANPIVFLDGTETEQAQYLTDTYQKVVDCEGSAYAWWNFQDTFWNQEEGLGLLRHGVIANPPNSLLDKPAATALSNLITNPPLANICTQPANYLDPYNCGFFNPTHHNAVTGTIVMPMVILLKEGWFRR
ncbi:MAG TPA: hypothetical protein PKL45_15145, partial [Bacteroidia bacterium]|nr:hypothetical protein [Bacteroidia bacterium]